MHNPIDSTIRAVLINAEFDAVAAVNLKRPFRGRLIKALSWLKDRFSRAIGRLTYTA